MHSYKQATIADAGLHGAWRRATFCGPNGGNCVEVNLGGQARVGLRDSKSAAGRVLVFGDGGWRAFVDVAKSGQFDRG